MSEAVLNSEVPGGLNSLTHEGVGGRRVGGGCGFNVTKASRMQTHDDGGYKKSNGGYLSDWLQNIYIPRGHHLHMQ